MELKMRAPVPAGSIETATGRVVGDDGYGRLLAALDEAHEVTDHVGVTVLGEQGGTWAFFTGDHLESDNSLHLGGENPFVVFANSTVAGSHDGTIQYCGGHTMGNGARTERFNVAGVAMTLTWTDPREAEDPDTQTKEIAMSSEPAYETERDVLRAMLEMHGEHEAPTARDVLGMQIRMTCARAGLPKPDLGHWPPSELASSYMEGLEG